MEIKICGIRRKEDIDIINRYKPDYIGFILAEGYKRTVPPETAWELKSRLADGIKTVGVFVNDSKKTVEEYARLIGLDAVQLHGDEDAEYIKVLEPGCEIWKVIRPRNGTDITDVPSADRLLIDKYDPVSFGGTGCTIGRDEVGTITTALPIMLAGGLSAENVRERIEMFRPQGVDVSSAVETNGFKDESKIRKFINTVRMI